MSCLESHGKRQTSEVCNEKAIERKKAESAKLKEKAIDVLEFLCSSMLCFMILWESLVNWVSTLQFVIRLIIVKFHHCCDGDWM